MYICPDKHKLFRTMYNLLKGKRGIIFGALNEQSIAWRTALRAKEEGAEFVLTNTPVSIRLGTINSLAEQCGTIVIPADATSVEDLEHLVSEAMKHLGGKIDFVLHAVGMSPNVRKNIPYEDIDYNNFFKTMDISAISFHKLMQTLYKMDAMAEYGSIVALSYIAATHIRRLWRYGRCEGDVGEYCPFVWCGIWSQMQGARKYRIPISDAYFRRTRYCRFERFVCTDRARFSIG